MTVGHVVHVDPDADVRSRVRRTLADAGLDVTTAPAAPETVPETVDCLVVEQDLPERTGLDWGQTVADRRGVGLVVYTDAGDESLAGEALAAGADGYVPKADGVGTLRDRVLDAVRDGPRGIESGSTTDDSLVERSPLAVVEWDADFRVRSWNSAAEDLFGYEAAAARGRHAADLVVPEAERDHVDEVWDRLLAAEGGTYSVNENLRADGERITCEWHNVPILEGGETTGVLSFVRDVSDRARRATALESLQGTTRDLLRAEDREAVAETAVEAARDVLGKPLATARLYDPDARELTLAAATEQSRDHFEEFPAIGPGDGIAWEVFVGDDTRVISADANETVHGESIGVEAALMAPLGDHGILIFTGPEASFDETDRHLADVLAATTEAALDRAERERTLARRERIMHAAGDGVYALDAEGRYTMVSDRMVELTGYSREELLGSHASMLIDEDDVEAARGIIRGLLGGDDDAESFEATLHHADGGTVPVEVTISLLPGEGFSGTVGVVRDVSDRVAIAAKLRERKEKIESLHEVVADLEECDTAEEVWDRAVEAAETVLAFDECDVNEVVDDQLISRATSAEMSADGYVERAPADEGIAGRTYRTGETRLVEDLRTCDVAEPESDAHRSLLSVPIGDYGVFQAVSSEPAAFDDSDAELAELLMTHVADALDRVAFESELREQRDRFAALFENVPDPVVYAEHDDGPIVRAINPAFERVFGFDEEEILDEDLDEYIVPPDRREEGREIDRLAHTGQVVEREVKRRTEHGLRDFVLTVVPVEVGVENPHTFAVYTDVTERKQRRQRVEVLNRVLRHDLRNGMNIVRGSAEMLREAVDGEYERYAETIEERADELIEMAETTRSFERSLADDARGTVDLADSVDRARETIATEHPDAEVSVDLPDEATVEATELLDVAVYHLLENACVHNDRDPDIRVSGRPAADGDAFVVEVADNGPGIPDHERALITEERDITQLRHTSGLGLWLVNWVVTQAGGELEFEDNDPRGTVVRLRLPGARLQLPEA